jgi:hypothetical protein
MAVGLGHGGEQNVPLAGAVIGGLEFSNQHTFVIASQF